MLAYFGWTTETTSPAAPTERATPALPSAEALFEEMRSAAERMSATRDLERMNQLDAPKPMMLDRKRLLHGERVADILQEIRESERFRKFALHLSERKNRNPAGMLDSLLGWLWRTPSTQEW